MMERQQEVIELNNRDAKVKKLVVLALFTAIVVVLQMLGQFIRLGIFNISLVLAPIVVGAALYGPAAGAWLGGVFGFVVIFTDTALFMPISPLGTILTVMVKGICAGLAAGAVYKLLEKKSSLLAVIAAAIACPVVNSGIFAIGCVLFFLDACRGWATEWGYANAADVILIGFIGLNFLVELAINLVLASVISRIIKVGKSSISNA